LLLATPACAGDLGTIEDFRAAAVKANIVMSLPDWEQTPEAIADSTNRAIAKANATLDRIAGQDPGAVTFGSTAVALDDLRAGADLVATRAALIAETNSDPIAVTTQEEFQAKSFTS
jgi:hypothetical protein